MATTACSKDDPFADQSGSEDGSSSEGSGGSSDPTASSATATMTQGSADATGDTGGPDDTGSAESDPTADDTADDTGAECPPTPVRFVVLGDSILACPNVGGKNGPGCAAKIVQEHISATVAPVGYENHAVNGAVTHDVPAEQLPGVPVGMPGHTIVLIYIGGNDLQPYIFSSDAETLEDYAEKRPILDKDWEDIFAFLNDPANFPDGVTVLMNTQYNPFDDCTAPPYNLSQTKIELLGDYNDDLVAKAEAQPNAWIADQHGPFLGHGHHYNVSSCPYYMEGAESWMFDLIHPNFEGHANLAAVLNAVVDEIYAGC